MDKPLDANLFCGVWRSVVFESNVGEFLRFTNLTLYFYRPGTRAGVQRERQWVAEAVYRDKAGAEEFTYPVAVRVDGTMYVGMFMDGHTFKYSLGAGKLCLEKTEGPRYVRAELRKISGAPGEPKHIPPWLIRSIIED